jgi:hypothetical protein
MVRGAFQRCMWYVCLMGTCGLGVPSGSQIRVVPCTTPGVGDWSLSTLPNSGVMIAKAGGSNAVCLDCEECAVGTSPVLKPCNASTVSQQWTLLNSTAGSRFRCDRTVPTAPQCVPLAAGSFSAAQCNEVCHAAASMAVPWSVPAALAGDAAATGTAAAPSVVLRSSSPVGTCLAVGGSDYTLGPSVTLVDCKRPLTSNAPDYSQRQAWSFELAQRNTDDAASSSNGEAMSIQSDGGGCCGDIFTAKPFCLSAANDFPKGCSTSKDTFPFCNTVRILVVVFFFGRRSFA